jgi:hypothetical protein
MLERSVDSRTAQPPMIVARRDSFLRDLDLGVTPGRNVPASLGEQAASAAAFCFQGRKQEILRFVHLVSDPDALPRIIYLTGAPGIGKTALIGAVQRCLHTEGLAEVVTVDSHEFGGNPEILASLVEERVSPCPRSRQDAPVVVVIDGYEAIGSAEQRRLRERFMARLMGPVLIVICARQPPLDLLVPLDGAA